MLINPVTLQLSRHHVDVALRSMFVEVCIAKKALAKAKNQPARDRLANEVDRLERAICAVSDALAANEKVERFPSLDELYDAYEREQRSVAADNRRGGI